jgi:hypothetical protein
VRREAITFTAAQACEAVTEVGDACGTGTVVYAGPSLSGGGLFTTAFPLPAVSWNNGQTASSSNIRTNALSATDGAANTAALAAADADTVTGTQLHAAAEACANMTYGGYSDWYLPASAEIQTLFVNRAALPVKTGALWTSSEVGQSTARGYDLATAVASTVTKSTPRGVLCVRSGATQAPAGTPCSEVTEVGGSCGNGEVIYAGQEEGGRLYTTSFPLPATFWNNGASTSSMSLTNVRSETDGVGNTAWLSGNDSDASAAGAQTHFAAETCASLNYLGHDDWYLPAPSEAARLAVNAPLLPPMGTIWTSAESTQTSAVIYDIGTGARSAAVKNLEHRVQCVRKDPIPAGLEPVTFEHTGSVQSWTAPATGVYRLIAYGAQGAPGAGVGTDARNGIGGQGGLAQGEVLLTAGQTVLIHVGGAGSGVEGGWNGGGAGFAQASNRISGGGGGGTDFRIGGAALSDRVLAVGGGGGGGGASTTGGGSPGGGGGGGYFGGGGGGGATGSSANACQAATLEGAFGSLGLGGSGGASGPCISGTYYAPGNGGAGGALTADPGSTGTTRGFGGGQALGGTGGVRAVALASAGGGGGGGSSYIGRVMNGTVTPGVQTGHGQAIIRFQRFPSVGDVALAGPEPRWFFDYTGSAQSWSAPLSGRYRIVAHGARGSDGAGAQAESRNGSGGFGALAIGDIALTAGTPLQVHVGERPMGGDGAASAVGGWNGGGPGFVQTADRASGGGGGATDVRVGGASLADRVLVAGGGGGGAGASTTGGGSPGGGGGGGYFGGGGGGGYTGSTLTGCQANTLDGSPGQTGSGGGGGAADCITGTYRAPNAGGNGGLSGTNGGSGATRGGGATQTAGGAGGAKSVATTVSGGGGGGGSSWVTGTPDFPVTGGSVTASTRRWHGFVTIEYLGP